MRNVKITILITLSIVALVALVACGPKKILYKEGVYEGYGEAYHGYIKVIVTTDQYSITNIEVIDDEPVPIVGEIVYKEIPKRVIKKNSVDVDIITGATYTSEGLLDAIEDALKKAKAKPKNEI
ncbi:FMN-binding protein [Wukongibacter baidiensis]|uniref:FMN-binding protein n=1 Tax=Wukongibacter baidiensis TaxID=1723361 RepID=UPI003D7FCF69